ncbi:hypothetical protein Patl1_29238 [Pistacia atlantica]|uniref:Uncharacterized protein n=1 Tax=Pistacia atlantica TaxID=434234 RepID=A0ACC1BCJ1_9ROSI|nr:hypothetical protein Patl1_29238 [Pistacia atlantica]
MACLRDEPRGSLSDMLSRRLSITEEEQKQEDAEQPKQPNTLFVQFPFEKVFPVYAMGFLSSDFDPLLSFPYSRADPIWDAVRQEAKLEAEKEPILSSFLYASILSHTCLEQALGFVLANRLQNPTLLATQLMDIFSNVMMHDKDIQCSIRLDVQAFKDRDPACLSYNSALLYLKGYHALQSYRVAHALWKQGRKVLAFALQSRISEVFGIDIHPGMFIFFLCFILFTAYKHLIVEVSKRTKVAFCTSASIGDGILLDHGTGVVIGETSVIGNRVSLMHGVTLGGTGKEIGDRHPKVGEGALIGACVNILGNIKVGEGAMIAAGSLVLKEVPPHRCKKLFFKLL